MTRLRLHLTRSTHHIASRASSMTPVLAEELEERGQGSQSPVKGAVRTPWGQRTQWEEAKLEGEPPEMRVVGIEVGY